MNPYNPPTTSSETPMSDGNHPAGLRNLIHRPAFAIAWIFASAVLGIGYVVLLFSILPGSEPINWTILSVFGGLGAVVGLLSWYMTRMVALKRISFVLLMVFYGFVTLFSLITLLGSIFVAIILGVALAIAYVVRSD